MFHLQVDLQCVKQQNRCSLSCRFKKILIYKFFNHYEKNGFSKYCDLHCNLYKYKVIPAL